MYIYRDWTLITQKNIYKHTCTYKMALAVIAKGILCTELSFQVQ